MEKNIIITAGPTNERIDSVMKITNMSTGALGAIIADEVLKEESLDKLYYLSTKLSYKPQTKSEKLKLITIETTKDLLFALKKILLTEKIFGVVHSAAVGDYYGEYVITGEMLAGEIAKLLQEKRLSYDEIKKQMIQIINNPTVFTDNSTKISSYEKNLMIKLGLTPKVIGHIKKYSPETLLIGFKLLDSVSKDELLQVALKLLNKNDADFIVANDLSKIGNGLHPATIISKDGVYRECNTKPEIAQTLTKILFK